MYASSPAEAGDPERDRVVEQDGGGGVSRGRAVEQQRAGEPSVEHADVEGEVTERAEQPPVSLSRGASRPSSVSKNSLYMTTKLTSDASSSATAAVIQIGSSHFRSALRAAVRPERRGAARDTCDHERKLDLRDLLLTGYLSVGCACSGTGPGLVVDHCHAVSPCCSCVAGVTRDSCVCLCSR